ncbi:MAG: TetR family transcriptional regulator [Phenylobacterium sp.]|nr:TetR family transcriptional regulator [Phenylobacterium sp.]
MIEATRAEMTATGSADVSLQAIARRAGVTAPLVTYHFKTKEALFLELARRDMEPAIRNLERLVLSDASPEEKLRLHIVGIISNYAQRPYLNSLLNLLLADASSKTSRQIAGRMAAPLTDALARILEQGAEAGVFRRVDPVMTYLMIVGACQYAFSSKLTVTSVAPRLREPDAIAAYARATAQMFIRGLSADRG